jgi:hypothetical protein
MFAVQVNLLIGAGLVYAELRQPDGEIARWTGFVILCAQFVHRIDLTPVSPGMSPHRDG